MTSDLRKKVAMKKSIISTSAVLILAVAASFVLLRPATDTRTAPRPAAHTTAAQNPQSTPAPPSREAPPEHPITPPKPHTTGNRTHIEPPESMPVTTAAQPEDDMATQLDAELAEQFETEALEAFPLHTVDAYNPLKQPGERGPAEGEVWIRIKVDHAPAHKDIMAQVAEHYKLVTRYDKPVTVLLWVGGRPWAKVRYPL